MFGNRELEMAPEGKLIVDGGMNILGDVVIDGDVDIDGVLGATTVRAKKIEIDIPAPDPDGTSNASIGNETLAAGESQVVVKTTKVTKASQIFITPTLATDKVLSVTSKTEGESFTVTVTSPATNDIRFSWWVVN